MLIHEGLSGRLGNRLQHVWNSWEDFCEIVYFAREEAPDVVEVFVTRLHRERERESNPTRGLKIFTN